MFNDLNFYWIFFNSTYFQEHAEQNKMIFQKDTTAAPGDKDKKADGKGKDGKDGKEKDGKDKDGKDKDGKDKDGKGKDGKEKDDKKDTKSQT